MNEDDGMLMNFSVPDAPVQRKVKVKGGRWSQRRKQQLLLEGREPAQLEPTMSESNFTPLGERKRKADTSLNTFTKKPSGNNGEEGIVSSLFTANPEMQQHDYEKIDRDTLQPSNAPESDPDADFKALKLHSNIIKCLDNLRFKKPTKIQRMVIPRLIQNQPRDILMQAQTGSGKTMAFSLPILDRLLNSKEKINRQSGLYALILTPTRELAQQIYSFLEEKLCRGAGHWLVPGIVIGGEKKKSEKARLRKGVNILVATPGRLVDHIEHTQKLDLSKVRYLVLDEGDRLMELGFEETITKIMNKLEEDFKFGLGPLEGVLPSKRVNILCSATLKGGVKKLGEITLSNAETVSASTNDMEETMAPEQLVQSLIVVPPKLRYVTLTAVLRNMVREPEPTKTIVFLSCSDSVDFHFLALTLDGKRNKIEKSSEENITAQSAPNLSSNTMVYKLHGSLSQQTRTATLAHFTQNTKQPTILLCTDVASRGLDLPKIDHVVEYDPPFALADHLHRVGRSARLGQNGMAILFLLPSEEGYADKVKGVHEGRVEYIKYEDELAKGFGQTDEPNDNEEKEEDSNKNSFKGNKFNREGSWDMHATTHQLNLERYLLAFARSKEIATAGFLGHVRAYTTHLSSEREWFSIKKVHLGHLAKSFGLRETPGQLKRKEEVKKDSKSGKNKLWKAARGVVKAGADEFNFA